VRVHQDGEAQKEHDTDWNTDTRMGAYKADIALEWAKPVRAACRDGDKPVDRSGYTGFQCKGASRR